MKNMKKLLALVIAVAMVLAMGVSVFAEGDYSITVKNAKKGETYSAYKMFDLSVDNPEDPKAFRYTVNSDWTAFTNTDEFKAAFEVDEQGYVTAKEAAQSETEWVAGSVMSKLAEAAAKYAKDNSIAAKVSKQATVDGDVKLDLSEAGYYVIGSTLGTRAMIETTPDKTAVTVNEKNSSDTITKEVKEDSSGIYGESNDAQVGQLVEFKSTATIVPRSINVKIHDTMTEGLSFTSGSIKIYTDENLSTELSSDQYEVLATPDTGDTFTIKIENTFAATATEDQTLYITYTATLNEKAVVRNEAGVAIVDANNKTKVSFGDGTSSEEDTTTTTTHKFSVFKHAKNSTDNLEGAKFKVSIPTVTPADPEDPESEETTTYTDLKLIKIDDNNYRIAKDGEEGAVDTFVTVAEGDIVIWGVDADKYALTEVDPPEGYDKLSAPVDVKVNANNSTRADIENNAGSELPTTGGIGTTIFYIVGAILVVGGGILLISRRRTSSN